MYVLLSHCDVATNRYLALAAITEVNIMKMCMPKQTAQSSAIDRASFDLSEDSV